MALISSVEVLLITPPGGWELLIILAIVLVLFGGAKLPGLARSMGQSITEFRKASKEGLEDLEDDESDAASERRDPDTRSDRDSS